MKNELAEEAKKPYDAKAKHIKVKYVLPDFLQDKPGRTPASF